MAMSPADEKVLVKYINTLAQAQQQNFRLEAEVEILQDENAALKAQIEELQNKDEPVVEAPTRKK